MSDIERRYSSTTDGVTLAKRTTATGQAHTICGYASVFNRETTIAGAFTEVIARGAFGPALERSDVRALVNHNASELIGRRKAGTLHVEEDAHGLFYRVQLPDTTVGRDVKTLIQRGDMTGSSFSFTVKQDVWTFPTRSGALPHRRIVEVDQLMDVSCVTYPAYQETSVQATAREARSHHEHAAGRSEVGESARVKAAREAHRTATRCARCGGALPPDPPVIGTGRTGPDTFEVVCRRCGEAAEHRAQRRAQIVETPEQQYRRLRGRLDVAQKILDTL